MDQLEIHLGLRVDWQQKSDEGKLIDLIRLELPEKKDIRSKLQIEAASPIDPSGVERQLELAATRS